MRFDVNLYLKEEGGKNGKKSLAYDPKLQKKNEEDFSERKIIAHSWLI